MRAPAAERSGTPHCDPRETLFTIRLARLIDRGRSGIGCNLAGTAPLTPPPRTEDRIRGAVHVRSAETAGQGAPARGVKFRLTRSHQGPGAQDLANTCSCPTLIRTRTVKRQAVEVSRIATAPDIPFGRDVLHHLLPDGRNFVVLCGDVKTGGTTRVVAEEVIIDGTG